MYIKKSAVLFSCMSLMTFASCTDDDNVVAPVIQPRTYSYIYNMPGIADEGRLILDSLTSSVASVGTTPSWLTITQNGDSDGHPVLLIANTGASSGNSDGRADVELTMSDGESVLLHVSRGSLPTQSNSPADAENFVNNWETLDYVSIYSPTFNKGYQTVPTPWSKRHLDSNIPEDIARNVKKADGWEMAFSLIGTDRHNDQNYFMLYNRYLGILRVFVYIVDPSTTGSEHCFEVILGSTGAVKPNGKSIFSHSLEYSIPASHATVRNDVDLVNSKYGSTFRTWVTPYTSRSSTSLAAGWTCFDIDMSAYTPDLVDNVLYDNSITVSCQTVTNQQITLAGTINADIAGRYSSAEVSRSAHSSGVSSTLASIGGFLGNIQNSALASITSALTGSKMTQAFYYAGSFCNGASYLYDKFLGTDGLNDAPTDSMPGKIDLSLQGKIDLSGYISSFASNKVHSLTVPLANMVNEYDCSIGKGVWNLAGDPVIYLIDDHMVGTHPRFTMYAEADSSYNALSDAEDMELRLLSIMDPESVVPVINPEIFPDLSDVKVVTYCGVYPYRDMGSTSDLRKVEGLNNPKIAIVDHHNTSAGTRITSSTGSKMSYHQVQPEAFTTKTLGGEAQKSQWVKQTNGNYSYDGPIMGPSSHAQSQFMLDPQIYFPVSSDGMRVYDGEMPDMVVVVQLSFKSDGRIYTFSKRYLPTYKVVSGSGVTELKSRIKAYSDKAANNQAISTVNGVDVLHPYGNERVAKSITILDKITD